MSARDAAARPSTPDFLTGGGEMGALMRAHDWAATPLGDPSVWPQSLRTAVALMLASRQPAYIAWGPEQISLCNDGYIPILGAKHPGGLGMPAAELWAEIWDELGPLNEAVYAGEALWFENQPFALAGRDRELSWFNFSYTPLRGEDGRVAGIYCAAVETTERVLAERALRESEARTRGVLEGMGEGFVLLDCDFRVLDINAEGLRLERRPRDEIVGRVHWEVWPSAEGSELGRLLKRAMAERAPVALGNHRVWPDDRDDWFEVRAYPSGDGLAIFYSDVTERVRAEVAIADSEARFRNMADHTPVMMWVTDPSGYCTYLNRRWYEFTGQAEGAGEGFGWLNAVHPDDRPQAERVFVEANAERRDYRVDFRLRRADGVYRWTIDAAAPRFAADGEYLGYVGSVIDIDERKDMEDALRKSEARLRLALEGAKLGTWDWDLRTMRGSWSPRTMEILGVDDGDDVTAERRTETIHPGDRERVWREYAEAVQTGDELVSEYRVLRPGGEVRWIASRGALQRDEAGVPVRASGIVLDVTERAAAEAALRELNETLEQRVAAALAERKVFADIVEGTDAFVQVSDPDFRWLAINRASANEFERIFGVRPQVGDCMLDLLADKPGHQAAVRAVWSRALAGEEFTEVGEFGDPGRERRFYEMKYNTLRDAEGRRIGAYQFVYDVTERIREQTRLAEAEAARREADEFYRAYFENTAEALFVVGVREDGGFVVEDLNPAHQASIGLPLAEVVGKRIDEILPAELARPVQDHYRRAIATDGVYQYRETFALHGRTTYWDTVLVPVRDERGRIVRLIGSSRDLTPQVAAEEQLRQSQKLEAMGSLTGGVAHDLNNLLTPITGALDLLQRNGLGGEREQRLIDGALQSAERARMLVQRLLAFARRQPLQPRPVDVGSLIAGMADLVDSTSGPQTKVAVDIAGDLPAAIADPNQLEMAILNLAVNARDAMPDGGRLTIAARPENVAAGHRAGLAPGRYVCLSVADTGMGMDAETLKRAVEPFYSTKGVGKGTGLGLSMVHGLAAQLGGALAIDSKPGVGTNVELWLPATEASAEQPERGNDPGVRAAVGTALLVDDEALVRASTADMLADLGYAVVEAGSAEEALRLLDAGLVPSVVLTDHLMPGTSGTEFAREVRRRLPNTRALVVSGYAEVEGVAPDMPRLVKPFRQADLAASLAALFDEQG